MPNTTKSDRKGHICPPSNANHPMDCWESLFIYSFVCKYTNLRSKVEGLESPMDFENALMSKEPNNILTQLLARFILNLKPQTRNLSIDQISTTLSSVLSEYFKSSERTVFWNEDLRVNIDPFEGLEGGFFTTDWDFKLKILRQLVELQLCHSTEIKSIIDRAWGVVHNKHKKKDTASAPPDATDLLSQDNLQLLPIGQDSQRKRYWIADDSPRVYVSTNPWKITATFEAVSSSREEYLALVENLKASAPPEPTGKKKHKRTKLELAHLALIATFEGRVETIDTELARVQRARKRIEQRRALLAQAEVRETRTRRRTQRPDYVYNNDLESDDDADDYVYQEDDAYDEEIDNDDFLNFRTDAPNGTRKRQSSSSTGIRRSARNAILNVHGKREGSSDSWSNWRGERRSSRLGAPPETQMDTEPPRKRARTEESSVSTNSIDTTSANNTNGASNGLKIKISGAAALKPTEIAMEQIAGKKRSKFWVYAVEPVPGVLPDLPEALSESIAHGTASTESTAVNGHRINGNSHSTSPSDYSGAENQMGYDRSLEGSLSPLESS